MVNEVCKIQNHMWPTYGVLHTRAQKSNTFVYLYVHIAKALLDLMWLPTNLDHVHAGKATTPNKCSTRKDMKARYIPISPTPKVFVNLIPL